MSVKIISFSQAPEGWDGYDCQELIAYCARVSNPSNQMNTETGIITATSIPKTGTSSTMNIPNS